MSKSEIKNAELYRALFSDGAVDLSPQPLSKKILVHPISTTHARVIEELKKQGIKELTSQPEPQLEPKKDQDWNTLQSDPQLELLFTKKVLHHVLNSHTPVTERPQIVEKTIEAIPAKPTSLLQKDFNAARTGYAIYREGFTIKKTDQGFSIAPPEQKLFGEVRMVYMPQWVILITNECQIEEFEHYSVMRSSDCFNIQHVGKEPLSISQLAVKKGQPSHIIIDFGSDPEHTLIKKLPFERTKRYVVVGENGKARAATEEECSVFGD